MTDTTVNETKTRVVSLNKEDLQRLSTPFLAITVPKNLVKQNMLALPAYWLQPVISHSSLLKENKLPDSVIKIFSEVLTESLLEDLWVSFASHLSAWEEKWKALGFSFWAEKQFLPGVTDNLAHVVEEAFSMQNMPFQFKVASGKIYLTDDKENLAHPEYKLYHPVVERFQIHSMSSTQNAYFNFPSVLLNKAPEYEIIDLSKNDDELITISKNRLLALSLEEMLCIKKYFSNPATQKQRQKANLPIWPTDAELEILAQTWSEHCKHKIFNAEITIKNNGSKDQVIKSLYKTYIQKATQEIQKNRCDLLSVFKDNSGVVKWNDKFAICFKVETHNSPSALEPYGGALTGILGVNRDILGTGLGAKPIFNTDILCFAYPDNNLPKRPKLLPPESIIAGVRQGIQDGGNNSGIPTVNGAVVFHPSYRAKPLVFCGTGGILPLKIADKIAYEKYTQSGDTIVMAGGRVGKDGIHGATFSSEALHEGSPVTAVQIGDAFTQKRLLDFVLAARDANLITGITDNGAGGLSSSVGEMATITHGAKIDLDRVPTKYPGLSAWEIIISESQERMTISTDDYSSLEQLAKKYNVEISAIGQFNSSGKFEVDLHGQAIVSLDLDFLHDGLPTLQLSTESKNIAPESLSITTGTKSDLQNLLLNMLSHPNICNRESIIRQYDHEVQGGSVIKPLMGPTQKAACDAAVITPILGDSSGLAISNGLCPQLSKFDAYLMAIGALDEAVRNAVCVGADPDTICILDNFCWPDPIQSPRNIDGDKYLDMLVKACQGLYDGALALGTPLISGKDSMKNNFDDGVIQLAISPTLLISAIGKVPDIANCISSDFKQIDDHIYLLSAGTLGLAGSILSEIYSCPQTLASLNLSQAKSLYSALHKAINHNLIHSAHDLSEGGLAVCIGESIIGSGRGAKINLDPIFQNNNSPYAYLLNKISQIDKSLILPALLFAEGPGQIIVTVPKNFNEEFLKIMHAQNVLLIGTVSQNNELSVDFDKKEFLWDGQALLNAWNRVFDFI